jgi:hypothetical protein
MALFGYGFGFTSRATSAASGGGGGPLPGFDFASVGTLEMWLDARDTASITESGGFVSAWANRAVGSSVASVIQGSAPMQPSLASGVLNGHDAISVGAGHYLAAAVSPIMGFSVYIYVLANRTGSAAGDTGLVGIYDSGMATGYWDLNLDISHNVVFNVSGTKATTAAHTMDTITPHILWGNQSTATDIAAGIDGGVTPVSKPPSFPFTNAIKIGDTDSSLTGFVGDITTVLVYSMLTPMEHTAVIGGLASIGSVP